VSFFLNIIASIIAALFIMLVVTTIKLKMNGISPISLLRTIQRIIASKIKYFYNDRKYLIKYLGTSGEFISSAEESIIYIGFWLSSSIDNSDFIDELTKKTTGGVTFSACFPNPSSPLMEYYSTFFGIEKEDLIKRINNNIDKIISVKEKLPHDKKDNIKIYTHAYPISASTIIIDNENNKKCKIVLDHKLPDTGRFFSYGFEIYGYKNQFCKKIIDSYKKLLNSNKVQEKENETM
jgi:hypothetical protein